MPITRMVRSLLGATVSRPRLVLVLFLLGISGLGWQAARFEIDASADTLVMRDDPDYVRTRVVSRRFSPQEFLLIAYQPKDHPLFSENTFADLRALRKRIGRLERVESVRSILDVPLFTMAGGGLSSMKEPAELTPEQAGYSSSELEEAFRDHPLYEDLLINREQTATALQVLFRSHEELEGIEDRIVALQNRSLQEGLDRAGERELERLKREAEPIEEALQRTRAEEIAAIRGIVAEYEDDARIYLGGLHVLGFQLIQIIRNDLVVFGSSIAAVICLALYLLFRRLRWVLIPAICCGGSVLGTMGLFGLLGFKTTVISSNFIVLQLILTLAIVIHLIVQYREYGSDHPGWDQPKLVRETLFRKASPCFYAGITTSVGFASLLFSGIQPVITFGWMMIIAMFFSIGTSLLLFPAVAVLFPREGAGRRWRISSRILGFFRRLALEHPALVGLTSAAVLVAAVGGLMLLDVENSFINYFRQSTRVHQELSFIDRQFGGSTPLDLVYTIPPSERKRDLVMTADTVQLLQRIQHALEQHEAVGKIVSVVNFTEVAKEVNDDRPLTEYELTALYRLMEESVREELTGAFFSPEHAQVRFSVRIKDSTEGLDRSELLETIRSDLAGLGIPEERYSLTSLFVLYQNILQQLFRSQILTLGIVYVVLALTFLAIFRSLRLALIGLAPNVLSTLAVLGVMGWLRIPLDLMTITIAAIAMGIAVDDTIHYIHRYREELDDSSARAVERSHASVGYAILFTSAIILIGFSLLAFSDFVPSVLFGLLTALAMFLALVFALCLLPMLLHRYAGRGR